MRCFLYGKRAALLSFGAYGKRYIYLCNKKFIIKEVFAIITTKEFYFLKVADVVTPFIEAFNSKL